MHKSHNKGVALKKKFIINLKYWHLFGSA